MTLFDPGPLPDLRDPKLSSDRRRTLRNKALLEAGRHPAGGRLAGNGETCGTCVHHVTRRHNRTWHKCELHRLGVTASAASDIRVGWPACERWEKQDDGDD